MLCSDCPINDSFSCLHITVYLAVMLQASWHNAEVKYESKIHISSHDRSQNFIASTLLNIFPRVSQNKRGVAGIRPSLTKY